MLFRQSVAMRVSVFGGGARGARVNKRRQWRQAGFVFDMRAHAGGVIRIENNNFCSLTQGVADLPMTLAPRAIRLFRGEARFRNNIGNRQRARDGRAQQIRRLVIKVIGKPKIGP